MRYTAVDRNFNAFSECAKPTPIRYAAGTKGIGFTASTPNARFTLERGLFQWSPHIATQAFEVEEITTFDKLKKS